MQTYSDRPLDELDPAFEAVPTSFHRVDSPYPAPAPDSEPAAHAALAEEPRTKLWRREELTRRPPVEVEDPPTVVVDLYAPARAVGRSPHPSPHRVAALPRLRTIAAERATVLGVAALVCGVGGVALGVGMALLVGSAEAADTVAVEPRANARPLAASAAPSGRAPQAATPARPAPARPALAPAELALETLDVGAVENHAGEAQAAAAQAEPGAARVETARPGGAVEASRAADPGAADFSAGELVADARSALDRGDAEAAEAAVDRVLLADTDPLTTQRLEAELFVRRGDGALAVPRLRELTTARPDPVLLVALGRALVQAEDDRGAARAFGAAIDLDPNAVDAHLELVHLRARAFVLGSARRHLEDARRVADAQGSPSERVAARLLVAEAVIEVEEGHLERAAAAAGEALDLDPRSSEAALLLARVALTRRDDPAPHLRAAVAGRAPAPAALAMLAARVEGAEACDLAARYLDRAPRGFDVPAMRRLARTAACR